MVNNDTVMYLLYLHPRVELVPQKVAQNVETYHGNADGEAGNDHHPGGRVDVRAVLADHRTPRGGGRLYAET